LTEFLEEAACTEPFAAISNGCFVTRFCSALLTHGAREIGSKY